MTTNSPLSLNPTPARTVSSSVAAGDPIHAKPTTPSAELSMSPSSAGYEELAGYHLGQGSRERLGAGQGQGVAAGFLAPSRNAHAPDSNGSRLTRRSWGAASA